MPKLPVVSGAQAIRALEKLGFMQIRQKGSHIVLRKDGAVCVVPKHAELKVGTLVGVLKQAGVSPEAFAQSL
jgi:predicted RNA binding protein YcfA (HicA-like mRNA interferase family)